MALPASDQASKRVHANVINEGLNFGADRIPDLFLGPRRTVALD
jgi:hypothetical protein